jgi:hypothetical protein
MSEVLRNSWVTTVFGSIQAEIATAGMRTPDRSKRNPCSHRGESPGGGAAGGGT